MNMEIVQICDITLAVKFSLIKNWKIEIYLYTN